MKLALPHACILALSLGTCLAEDITIKSNTTMRSDHSLVSLKAGTVVEVVERGDKTISILYKGQAGTVPTSSLTASASPSTPSAPVAAKPASPTKTAPASNSVVVDH